MSYEDNLQRIGIDLWDITPIGIVSESQPEPDDLPVAKTFRVTIDGHQVGMVIDESEAKIVRDWLAGALTDIEDLCKD